MYSRTGYARLSAIAQITTASTAARLVSRVVRGEAGGLDRVLLPVLAPAGQRREARVSTGPGVARGVAEQFLDAQQLVVLGHALAARGRPGLDLAAIGGDGEIGDRRVIGLAGA